MKTGNHGMIFSPSGKYLNDIKLKNMERSFHNYGRKNNEIKLRYNEPLKNHQKDIIKLRNDMENSINLNQQSRKINDKNNNDEISDENEQKNQNEGFLHDLQISIPSKEGIRNEYINSQVNKIKNSDNSDNNYNK